MDETDFIIVKKLMENSRVTIRELEEMINISVSAIHKRIKNLVDEGNINAFVARPSVIALKYLAVIIFLWIGYREMYVSTLILNMILSIYTVIGTVLEERKLIIELGDNYQDYQKKVSMLFPTKWILSKLNF